MSRLVDLHIHPNWSLDAVGETENFVLSAIDKNLEQICFTTHIELDPDRRTIDSYHRVDNKLQLIDEQNTNRYISQIRELAEKYRDKIDIRAGFEMGWNSSYAKLIEEFIRKFDIDFVIGSVHTLDGIALTSSNEAIIYLAKTEPQYIAKRYIKELILAAKSGLFNTLGHIDGYKKYLSVATNSDWEYTETELFEKLFTLCKENGIMIELNTSATKKSWLQDFYPSEWLLPIMKDCGLEILPLGSDAHKPKHIAWQFEKAKRLIDKYGFTLYEIGGEYA